MGIELINEETGEIRTIISITDNCWAGFINGGFVPCEGERFIASVKSMEPFKADIAVQKLKAVALSNYENWVFYGNDNKKQESIYGELIDALNKKAPNY